MDLLTIIGIAIGLAMDAFAVSIASSILLGGVTGRQTFRIAFHFGLFQALMPLAGWFAGRNVIHLVEQWDHWVAFALLALIGGKAIYGALRNGGGSFAKGDPTRGLSLVLLALATSMDALAVGVSFAMLKVDIWYPSAIIGLITGTLCIAGMRFGHLLGARFGKRMEVIGGLVLVAIGIKILIGF
ncbi:MAG TPA: manganese efflux pump MntP family protein [Acidobacteriota bacterium]|nr:manganese efflux pump MntP family protein [Acidobacteriota bacterium]